MTEDTSRKALATFGKGLRLRKGGEIKHALRQGRKVVTRYFVFVAVPSQSAHPRLGIVVTKKIGNAVVRNKLKRQIRECFRLHQNVTSNIDVVVIGRKAAVVTETKALVSAYCSGINMLHQRMGLEEITLHQ